MGRNSWVVRNAMSGLSILKRVVHQSVKTPRPGQLSTSTDDRYLERVREGIQGNRRLSVQEVAEVGISVGSCHAILTQKPQMHHVSAKFVPRLC